MSARSFTDEQAIEAIKDTRLKSVRQVLKRLSASGRSGSNYQLIYKIVKKYNLDTSHWLGNLACQGINSPLRVDASEYFRGKRSCSSHCLKLRLLRDGYKKAQCEICGLTTWMNHPIPLELDHINGRHSDNSFSNLRIVCPNCHTLQPTSNGKNVTFQKKFRAPFHNSRRSAMRK